MLEEIHRSITTGSNGEFGLTLHFWSAHNSSIYAEKYRGEFKWHKNN